MRQSVAVGCDAEGATGDAILPRSLPGRDDEAWLDSRLSWRLATGFVAATSLGLWFALWKLVVGAAQALG